MINKTREKIKKKRTKSQIGKTNRVSGQRFELKVRADMESKGWIVDRWSNNVELPKTLPHTPFLIPAKSRFNMRTTGFPDFIAFRYFGQGVHKIIGVECKSNGYLDKIEKEKCKWLLENKIFSQILIASKGKKRGTIIYKEFEVI